MVRFIKKELNTSHVKVNRKYIIMIKKYLSNLNTSHVKVNHTTGDITGDTTGFKYISC